MRCNIKGVKYLRALPLFFFLSCIIWQYVNLYMDEIYFNASAVTNKVEVFIFKSPLVHYVCLF